MGVQERQTPGHTESCKDLYSILLYGGGNPLDDWRQGSDMFLFPFLKNNSG